MPRLIALVAVSMLLASCAAPEAAPSGSHVVAEMTDYKITLNVTSVKVSADGRQGRPFTIKVGVRNLAAMEHSLEVLKTDIPHDKLPVDGATAKAKEDGKVGEIKSIPAGKSAAVTIDFSPGNYVFICNVAGHYLLGMHTALTVEP